MVFRNILILVRFVLLPFVIYYITQESHLVAFTLFVIILALHLFEFKSKKVDSFLRPFSLKIIVSTLLFIFFLKKEFWLLPFLLFVIRDVAVGFIRKRAIHDEIIVKGKLLNVSLVVIQSLIILGLLTKKLLFFQNMQLLMFQFILLFTILAIIISLASVMQYLFVYTKTFRKLRKKGKRIDNDPLVILANRRSRGFKDKYRKMLLKTFAKRRNAKIIFLPNKTNMFQGISKQIKGYKNIIIAGGDGSFEAALNHKPFHKKNLGFLPLGAGNALYSYFYKGKRFEYLRNRFPFHEMEMDVIQISYDKGTQETSFFSVGLDSEVIRFVSKTRGKHGFRDAVNASIKVIMKARPSYDVDCKINGKKYEWENMINFNFGKVPYFGFGIRSLIGHMEPDDGNILGMVCINSHSAFLNKGLRLWGLVMAMFGLANSPLFPVKGRVFEIKSEVPIPLQAGGEFLGYTHKLKAKVIRKQKVLVV